MREGEREREGGKKGGRERGRERENHILDPVAIHNDYNA